MEDDPFLADDLNAMLVAGRAHVIGPFSHLCDADEALQRGARPDFAILDVKLVDGTAFQIARDLAAMGVPFVFATGYGADDLPAEFRQAAVVQKPYRMRSILEAGANASRVRP